MMSEIIRKERKRSRIFSQASGPEKHAKNLGEPGDKRDERKYLDAHHYTREKNAEARWRSTKNSSTLPTAEAFYALHRSRSDSYAQFRFARRRERLEEKSSLACRLVLFCSCLIGL